MENAIVTKKCNGCGNEFDSYASQRRLYCSRKCYSRLNIKPVVSRLKQCPVCNKFFPVIGKSGNSTYCPECINVKKNAAWIANHFANRVKIVYECRCDCEKKHKHHFSYAPENRFNVLLLCPACHLAEHRRLRCAARKEIPGRSPRKRSSRFDGSWSSIDGQNTSSTEAAAGRDIRQDRSCTGMGRKHKH